MDQNYWELGTWGRIPVAMHWTVLLSFAWMYLIFWSLPGTLVGAAAFFVVLVVHELGHVVALRRRKISIDRITLFGIHGEVSHGYAGPAGEIAVAWAGVAAQVLLLVLALVLRSAVDFTFNRYAARAAGTVLFVWVNLNVFVIVVALLPIGPFDGRAAWTVFPYMRGALRRCRRLKQERLMFPERSLTPERRRELEESSTQAAADLLGKFSSGSGKGREDV